MSIEDFELALKSNFLGDISAMNVNEVLMPYNRWHGWLPNLVQFGHIDDHIGCIVVTDLIGLNRFLVKYDLTNRIMLRHGPKMMYESLNHDNLESFSVCEIRFKQGEY